MFLTSWSIHDRFVAAASLIRRVIVLFLVVKCLNKQECTLQNSHETNIVVGSIAGTIIASQREMSGYTPTITNQVNVVNVAYINLTNTFYCICCVRKAVYLVLPLLYF